MDVEILSHTSIDMRMMYASWSGKHPNLLVTCKIPHKGITADSLADLAPVALGDEMRWPLLALHLHPSPRFCAVWCMLLGSPSPRPPSRLRDATNQRGHHSEVLDQAQAQALRLRLVELMLP